MSEQFCTYFDHRYIPKGLAMWRSLKAQHADAVLHVLCLSEACIEILRGLRLTDVHLHGLDELEGSDPELLLARANRSLVEYYFTLTPCFPLRLLKTSPGITRLTYVDADLYFFASPQPILDEVAGSSIGLIEHRFPDDLAHLASYGRFNVGWLTFRTDETALACLESWRRQCIEWCYDRLEDDRFAEQKYLDDWPTRFPNVRIIQHPGANVAPWNLNRFKLSVEDGAVRVDGHALIFLHAHGYRIGSPGQRSDANLDTYGVRPSSIFGEAIFGPYERSVQAAAATVALPMALALLADHSRDTVPLLEHTRARVRQLEEQLASSESDRAARLDAINQLIQRLEASEADRAARLMVIQELENARRASELERVTTGVRVRQLEAELAAVTLSRTWRWTRPLRFVLGFVGRFVR
jgi:hypothetical protein